MFVEKQCIEEELGSLNKEVINVGMDQNSCMMEKRHMLEYEKVLTKEDVF